MFGDLAFVLLEFAWFIRYKNNIWKIPLKGTLKLVVSEVSMEFKIVSESLGQPRISLNRELNNLIMIALVSEKT